MKYTVNDDKTITLTINHDDLAIIDYAVGYLAVNQKVANEDKQRAKEIDAVLFDAWKKLTA